MMRTAACCGGGRASRVWRGLTRSGLALVAAFAVACAIGTPVQAQTLEGVDWVLSSHNGTPVLENTQITARFEDGSVSGSAGCNRYFADYEAADGALTFSGIGQTMMACPEPIQAQEDAYLKVLDAARGYSIEAGELYLLDGERRAIAEFVRADLMAQTLEATQWLLVAYDGKQVLADTQITARFEDGRLTGSAGCNQYFADYETDDLSVTIGEIGSTRKACPEPIMAQEDAYLRLLRAVASYSFETGALSLLNKDGRVILDFVPHDEAPEAATDLEGIEWVLVQYDGNSVLEDTQITARFDEGSLTGSAGCNRYFGGYKVQGAALTLSEIGSTKMACPEPTMKQEHAYLEFLKTVNGYQIEAQQLYLSRDGVAILTFVTRAAVEAEKQPAQILEIQPSGLLRDGQFWVPVRPILDWLRADIAWDPVTQTVFASRGDKSLDATIGHAAMFVNNQAITLSSEVFEIAGRTYLPLQVLADAFGFSIEPTAGTHTVTLIDSMGRRGFPMREDRAAGWQSLLESVVDLESRSRLAAPGVVLFVDSPDGRYVSAAGVTDLDSRTPVQIGDRFQIGSCTKAFTVILALQLQEEGVWSMDDPVLKWLPDLAMRTQHIEEITLRQLAGNTSGLWDYAEELLGSVVGNPDALVKGYTPEELIGYASENGESQFEPGTAWGYSSTNFILLGMAIEAATGESLADLYEARIFDPIGMDESFLLEGSPEPGQIVHGYYRGPDGEFVDSTNWNASMGGAAGAIVSTAEDMGRFVIGLTAGDLFKNQATLDEMLTMRDIAPENQAGGYARYGLGVASTDWWQVKNIGHTGQTVCFTAIWTYLPDSGTAVVMMSNSADCSLLPILAAHQDLFPDEEGMTHGVRRAIVTTP